MRPIPLSIFFYYMWQGGKDWRSVRAKPIYLPRNSFFCISADMQKARGGGVNIETSLLIDTLKDACKEQGLGFRDDADIAGASVEVCGRSVISLDARFTWPWGVLSHVVKIQWKRIPITGTKKSRLVAELRTKTLFSWELF